jgi:hypothetical protein
VNPKEQATFHFMTAELSKVLAACGEGTLAEHPSFSTEPGWSLGSLHVHVVREGAAPFVFIAEDDWVRVDVGLLPEVLSFPLSARRRLLRRQVTFAEALPRLLTSSVTVRRQGRKRSVLIIDRSGDVWRRYSNYRRSAPSEGPADGTYRAVVTCPAM